MNNDEIAAGSTVDHQRCDGGGGEVVIQIFDRQGVPLVSKIHGEAVEGVREVEVLEGRPVVVKLVSARDRRVVAKGCVVHGRRRQIDRHVDRQAAADRFQTREADRAGGKAIVDRHVAILAAVARPGEGERLRCERRRAEDGQRVTGSTGLQAAREAHAAAGDWVAAPEVDDESIVV